MSVKRRDLSLTISEAFWCIYEVKLNAMLSLDALGVLFLANTNSHKLSLSG
ncbi:hypothetical protein WNY77_10480 [Paraglaciecola mesophila]|uniref:Uncharacterized protein n=2 Tax=Paraglaciecola mesophila TaxID=197222 RepID=K6ZD06_9ALTE|nr:hypothetical protein [Paraglaciecola mesophila]GAC26818.1 hypothetical protein GMES_4552 [Paraglaciecola mesophila KMM 241]